MQLARSAHVLLTAGLFGGAAMLAIANPSDEVMKGYDITPSGLSPAYPDGFRCSPLTSLYASWIDVDGSRRSEPHSGVDAGRLGEPILSPGPGTVRAAWLANWGWGSEGALIIRHTREELNLTDGAPFYYSEFDHLKYSDVRHFKEGQQIARGEKLAEVYRPGGNRNYLPEVHWEVWEIGDDDDLSWSTNKFGGEDWINESARLMDPLYLLSRNTPPGDEGKVLLTPFVRSANYDHFVGFTYILPCRPTRQSINGIVS
jgi:murein DD-endopeptidase MepM/ murein hydrolase activator NlpD